MRRINIDGFEMEIAGDEPAGPCAMCGSTSSNTAMGLRPYGPNYEEICYQCAGLDPKRTMRQIRRFLKKLVFLQQFTEVE